MISLTEALDLGADRTRMKDRCDVERQNETARQLLERLYNPNSPGFLELQLLADEVGMGKTFVALAVAYSVLEAHKASGALSGCYQKVLVLVPQNDELMRKWHREVGELVKRCAVPAYRSAAAALFSSQTVERPDELVAALRRGEHRIVVAKTSALGARVRHEELKTRLTLGALFRHFGRALPLESREVLLKAAGWKADLGALSQFDPDEEKQLRLPVEKLEAAIRSAAEGDLREKSGEILALCKEWSVSGVRGRPEGMATILKKTLHFYKDAVWTMLRSDLPLVIVDEAPQWKNKLNDFSAFAKWIAPRTRRALLLTATPFQLDPSEIIRLLEVGDYLKLSKDRLERLTAVRELMVKPALQRAQTESLEFSKQWSTLGSRLDQVALREAWDGPALVLARDELADLARTPGALHEPAVERVVQVARVAVAPELRDFACQALRLYAFNRDLGAELGRFVVRHRRSTKHRVVRAGGEIDHAGSVVQQRPDAHVLHAAPGLDVRGDDELPLYLLMRATSELENGKRTANLGSSLTGCYSTFFHSAASASFAKVDAAGKAGTYVRLLKDMVGDKAADATHPKMRRVVQEVVERWERGEKSLIFTFRVNTAERLHELIGGEITARLEARRTEALGGDTGLAQFRQRLSTKTQSLYQPMLDRVLWSMLWAPPDEGALSIGSTDLWPTSADYREIARLALTYGEDLLGRPADRVFLHRATEHSLALRLRERAPNQSRLRAVLDKMADESWVQSAYGGVTAPVEAERDDLADERGVQSIYQRQQSPSEEEIDALARELVARDKRAQQNRQVGIIRQAFLGPSFWLGAHPETELLAREQHPADVEVNRSDQRFLHVQLRELTWNADGELDFRTRALAFKAMRRAMLRESILVRLLPKHEEREDEHWATLLVQHFTERASGRSETMLRLVGVFIEDLASASGAIDDPKSARGSLYEATKSNDTVALVKGGTDNEARSRRFQGFNTPLLPEILICGQVAQEGIDLHRHCSHVIHYDLAWNPATLEQRTGRVDRIGSRTQRLRQLTPAESSSALNAGADARLEVNVPYLAGTYDERMFEELRLRAQTFEVLLGGDLSGSRADEQQDEGEDQERAFGLTALPDAMADCLRVDLAVWKPQRQVNTP